MSLDSGRQIGTFNPLAPAQSAIRFCLANMPAFMAFVDQLGSCEPDATAAEIEHDLHNAHNAIGEVIERLDGAS